MLEPQNKEFIRLMKAVGWSQNETARRLHMTGGGVSQICTGKVRPSKGRLTLLRLLVEREDPNVVKQLTSERETWAEELVDGLRSLPEGRRSAVVEAFKHVIRAINNRPRTASGGR